MYRPKRPLPLLLALAAVAALALLFAGCYPSHNQSTFDALGPVSRKQLLLFQIIFWTAVFVFVAVEGILIYSIIRYRRRPGQGLPIPVHGNTRLEIVWTIAPAIVLAVIAVPTVLFIFQTANVPEDEKDPLHVTVVGHQWWWEFRYPEEYGNVVTANELVVPEDRAVVLTLNSADVIHSFWIPKLAGKVDVIPNRNNTMWFKAEEVGLYFGQCAELCGIAHAHMRFRVRVQAQEEFQEWARLMKSPPSLPSGLAITGQKLFSDKGCIACHTIEGTQAIGKVGPNLTRFGVRTSVGAGLLDNSEESLARWLRDPAKVKPGNFMASDAPVYRDPKLKLTEEEITALVAYLHSLN